jgi:hypothetical protein
MDLDLRLVIRLSGICRAKKQFFKETKTEISDNNKKTLQSREQAVIIMKKSFPVFYRNLRILGL